MTHFGRSQQPTMIMKSIQFSLIFLALLTCLRVTAGEQLNNSVNQGVVQQFPTENSDHGRTEGTAAYFSANNAVKKANASYPEWFRGEGKNGLADDNSLYWYTSLIPLKRNTEENIVAKNLNLGILELKPGATYPAHSHPANELYFVLDGVADWYVNDEKQHVTAGSVIRHRPYDVHGWINTSDSAHLTVVWLWWLEGKDTSEILDQGARFTNPGFSAVKNNAKPYAIPLPKTYGPDRKVTQDYPGEYPVYGRLEGTTAFFHENDAVKVANDIHPDSSQVGKRNNSEDRNSSHGYKHLVTPRKFSEGNLEAENLYFGTVELEAGATNPTHVHVESEVYLILDGEADWYINEEKKHVMAGTVIKHRANSVHRLTNTHDYKQLKVIRVRWLESEDDI
jgi:quercetin dioxygenase-like cupin family protein